MANWKREEPVDEARPFKITEAGSLGGIIRDNNSSEPLRRCHGIDSDARCTAEHSSKAKSLFALPGLLDASN